MAFWKIQLDYIYFCYGLSFILLGASCLYYGRLAPERLPLSLRFLGLFGIVHGGYEWIELLALNVGDDLRFRIVRLILMAVSFFLLWEAGRSGGEERWRRRLLSYPLLALLLIVAEVFDGDLAAANGVTRYLLAFPGGMLVAGFLLSHARPLTSQPRLWLTIMAIAFGGYAVAAGLVVPASELAPSRLLNQDDLLGVTGVPVQAIRCFFAMVAAFALMRYQCERTTSDKLRNRLRRQLSYSALSLLAVLAVGGLLTRELGDYFEGELSEDVAIELSLLSGTVSGQIGTANSLRQPEIAGFSRLGDDVAFLVDRDGMVLVASGTEARQRSLWPLPSDDQARIKASGRFDALDFSPLLKARVENGDWISRAGQNYLVGRTAVNEQGWSIVLLRPNTLLATNRLFSIIATLLVCLLVIVYHNIFSRQIVTKFALAENQSQLSAALHDLRTAETQLVHTEKMASLGVLVAGIAHELNNPISFVHSNYPYLERYIRALLSILDDVRARFAGDPGAGPWIDQRLSRADYEYLKEDILKIISAGKEGAERVREIVLSLRRFSRLDEGEFKAASLEQGLDDTLAILHTQMKTAIVLKRDYRLNEPVPCYPGQINQVFMNILFNAIQAIDGTGEITVATRREGECAMVTIDDTGKGIPPDIVSKIFDPFFTTKAVGEGTGLGLSISHGIIEKHGGQIAVTSDPGRKTSFVIRIPLVPPMAAKKSPGET